MADNEVVADEANQDQAGEVALAEAGGADRLDLNVDIKDVGPCKKHISVTVSAGDIEQLRNDTISDLSRETAVPGFRAGKVPERLLAKRFRKEIADQLKQKILLHSTPQVSKAYMHISQD